MGVGRRRCVELIEPIAGRDGCNFHLDFAYRYPTSIFLELMGLPAEDLALFQRTAHTTHCPYKGDASYFTLTVDGRVSENAAWSYEAPYPAMAEIAELLAFYPGRVERIEEEE